ncbi:hypothetical protein GGR54DRAFT_617801 [Hypoxylon sp. NC1633]|nr:hypothetical protein GGR54DRAFT_617801 [Hypoxylon sp. NC1633]
MPDNWCHMLHEVVADLRDFLRNGERLPDPMRLENLNDVEAWFREVQGKLDVDERINDTEKARFYYVFGLISRPIQSRIVSVVDECIQDEGWTYIRLVDRLRQLHQQDIELDDDHTYLG